MYKKFIFTISIILFIIINFYSYSKNEELLKIQKTLNLQKVGLKKLSILNDINVLLKEYRGMSQFPKSTSLDLDSKLVKINVLVKSMKDKKFSETFLHFINIDSENSKEAFYEYTKAVNYLESMIIKTAIKHKLFGLSNKDTYKYMSTMVYTLPKMIEIVGKVRGMGIASIVNKKISNIEKFILDDNLNTYYLYMSNLPLDSSEIEVMSFIYEELKMNINKIKNNHTNLDEILYYDKYTEYIESIYGYYYILHNKFTDIVEQNQQNIYDEDDINISYYFFYMMSLLITTVFSYDFLRRFEERKNLDAFEYSIMNLLYEKFSYASNLKELCDISIGFLVEKLSATNGQLYIVDNKNKQLSLASTYNMSARHLKHLLDMDEGIFCEVLQSKEIKILGESYRIKVDFGSFKAYINKIITIPLISDDGEIVAIAQLNFMEEKDVYKSFEKIFNVIANNILKSQKNEENEKYFNLIDKYVITSTTNKDGIINYASQAFSEISGFSQEELLGSSHSILKHEDVPSETYKDLWNHINQGKTWTSELLNKNKDGSSYWIKATISPEFGFYGDIVGFTSIRENITDKKMVEELSIRDPLTSLYNRRHFDEEFLRSINLVKRIEKTLTFAMIDIDHFKQYNDTYGHQKGDITLVKVAKVLRKSFKRDIDMVFRLGGEEFGILFFTNTTKDALEIGKNIIQSVENLGIEHTKSSASSFVTISMGLYIYNDENMTVDDVYKETDLLLYKAKESGRNKMISNKKEI